jgi:hypothetical protein
VYAYGREEISISLREFPLPAIYNSYLHVSTDIYTSCYFD